jgi:hypothetical protein
MDTTHAYYCYCGCGGTVEVTFDGGFNGTTATITPCPKAPAYINAFTVRKSAVLEMQPITGYTTLQHEDGLVTF